MKCLFIALLMFNLSYAKYDVIYNEKKLGEIINMETINDNYIEIKLTNKLAKFFISKEKFVLFNENYNKPLNNQKSTKYKEDKYQILEIIKLSKNENIHYKKINISNDKYIELWFDKKNYFKYTSKKMVKSEGYLTKEGKTLLTLVDTKNNIKILLN